MKYAFIGQKEGIEFVSTVYPELAHVHYNVYRVIDEQQNEIDIGIPIKSAWTIETYLKTHNSFEWK